MSGTIQFINTTPEELLEEVDKRLEEKLEIIKKNFQPKEPTQYVTRNYVAEEMLFCDLSTVHNLTVRGILKKYGIGGRVLYKRREVEDAIIALDK
ncbi:DNA-binding protein [Ulvibacterium sp.]|uniref:DNA-binding protein n=1 Tax=Ulvibacterium sp. TaxID=2665914 RepID=UPI0026161C1A|nr:DNA-binding protein [Ulvibacterium sp.]